jgi:alpha-ribazole phosphatase
MPRRFFIDLLRHGETENGPRYWGSTDVALSETGWTQMWAAVSGEQQWAAIYSSPLARCAMFAQRLGEQRGIPVHIDNRLRELHFGRWEGRSSLDLMEAEPQALLQFWEDPWKHGPPDGESVGQLHERVLEAWHEITQRRQPALVISHGGPLRMIRLHLHGWPPEQLLNVETPYATLMRAWLDAARLTYLFEAPDT